MKQRWLVLGIGISVILAVIAVGTWIVLWQGSRTQNEVDKLNAGRNKWWTSWSSYVDSSYEYHRLRNPSEEESWNLSKAIDKGLDSLGNRIFTVMEVESDYDQAIDTERQRLTLTVAMTSFIGLCIIGLVIFLEVFYFGFWLVRDRQVARIASM